MVRGGRTKDSPLNNDRKNPETQNINSRKNAIVHLCLPNLGTIKVPFLMTENVLARIGPSPVHYHQNCARSTEALPHHSRP